MVFHEYDDESIPVNMSAYMWVERRLTYDIEFIPKYILIIGPNIKYDTESVFRIDPCDQSIAEDQDVRFGRAGGMTCV